MREIFVDNPGNDILLMIIVALISIVTTIGGVGGGGLLIPLYMLVGNFELEIFVKLVTLLSEIPQGIIFLYGSRSFFIFKQKP